jgi:hypothetical protein
MGRALYPARTKALFEAHTNANMNATCAIQTYVSQGDDGKGGEYGVWTTLGAVRPCRVNPTRRPLQELIVGAQIAERSYFTVVFVKKTIVPAGARFSCTIDGEVMLLNPQGVNGPRSNEFERKYECELWRGAPDRPAPED